MNILDEIVPDPDLIDDKLVRQEKRLLSFVGGIGFAALSLTLLNAPSPAPVFRTLSGVLILVGIGGVLLGSLLAILPFYRLSYSKKFMRAFLIGCLIIETVLLISNLIILLSRLVTH